MKNFNDELITDPMQRIELLHQALRIPMELRQESDLKVISTLLLDFKTFVELASLRLTKEPRVMMEIARSVDMVEYKPSQVVAK